MSPAAARNNVVIILRVQVPEFIVRYTHHFADLLEMQVTVNLECVNLRRHAHGSRIEAIVGTVGKGIHNAHKSRQIASCLFGKVWIHRPEVPASASSSDGLVDIPGAAVIGAYRKRPVAEHIVQALEVTCRCVGRLLHVHALIDI